MVGGIPTRQDNRRVLGEIDFLLPDCFGIYAFHMDKGPEVHLDFFLFDES